MDATPHNLSSLTQRIEQAIAADQRLARRLDAVNGAEERLRTLLNDFRQQTSDAFAVIKQLGTFREQARQTADEVLQGARQQLGQLTDTLSARMAALTEASRQFEGKSGQWEAEANRRTQDLQQAVSQCLAQAEQRVEGLSRKAGEAAALAGQSLEQATHELKSRVGGVVEDLAAEVRGRLQEAAEDATTRAQQAVSGSRVQCSRDAAQTAEQFRKQVREMVLEMEQGADAMLSAAENRLAQRVAALRPATQAALDQAQQALTQRLNTMVQQTQARFTLSEKQLADRIDALRPRCAAVLRELESELARRAADLESQANATTAWLERRLLQRVDELVEHSRRTLEGQISEVEGERPRAVEVQVLLKETPAKQAAA